jgi:chromosome segregation ATPase
VETIKIELTDQETELKKLEKKLVQLEKQNERFHKEIESWKQKIIENEEKINVNISEQGDMRGTIEKQKEMVRDVEIKLAKAEG